MKVPFLTIATLLITAAAGRAQISLPQATADSPTVVVPAGTTLLTQLERPISTRTARPGENVYLQISHPLIVNDTVIIPAGTYMEATLVAITAHGWRQHDLELRMRLTRMVFANGYVVAAADSVLGRSANDADVRDDGARASTAVTSLAIAGTAIGALSNGIFGAIAGGALGSTIGSVVALAGGGNAQKMDAGSPLDLTFENPIALNVRRATAYAPVRSALATLRRPGAEQGLTCYNPGTPGTPDLIIPGAPGTPGMGEIPGTPPSPPTIIPGMPGTPGYWYSCR